MTAPTGVAALIAEGQTLHSKRSRMSKTEGAVLAEAGPRRRCPQGRGPRAEGVRFVTSPRSITPRPGPGVPHGTTEAFGNMRGKTSADFWRTVRCLVIDEISMVDAEFLDWRSSMVAV